MYVLTLYRGALPTLTQIFRWISQFYFDIVFEQIGGHSLFMSRFAPQNRYCSLEKLRVEALEPRRRKEGSSLLLGV